MKPTIAAFAAFAFCAALPAAAFAQETDARWTAVRGVLGQDGTVEDGYLRVEFPRTDVHVKIGADALAPSFEFVSFIGFRPLSGRDVMGMGEVVMREDEVAGAVAEARRQGVRVTALHNHLLGESPRILYMHMMAEGPAASVAAKLKAVLAKTATPLTKPADEPPTADWSAIDAILGKHEKAEGAVAEYEFARRDHITVGGHPVKSTGAIETGSEANFQRLPDGRIASTGELYLRTSEVEDVLSALTEHGLHVTALHMHSLDDSPTHYWIHWYATGDGPTLARGVAAALSKMNSEQQSGKKK